MLYVAVKGLVRVGSTCFLTTWLCVTDSLISRFGSRWGMLQHSLRE